jgi:hypothetical protein
LLGGCANYVLEGHGGQTKSSFCVMLDCCLPFMTHAGKAYKEYSLYSVMGESFISERTSKVAAAHPEVSCFLQIAVQNKQTYMVQVVATLAAACHVFP